MRKMAELQLNVVGDPKSKTAILKQISQWEENLEKLHVELYRVRCYVSSLQGCELPNPKVSYEKLHMKLYRDRCCLKSTRM